MSSREQAIAEAATHLGHDAVSVGDNGSRFADLRRAEVVLDAAHQAGHIFYKHELTHVMVTAAKLEIERNEARAEVERLRAAIREAIGLCDDSPVRGIRLLKKALDDGEEGEQT